MMPGGLLSWSVDICLDHMFFVLIGDGHGVLGWLMVGGAKHQSLNPKSSITVYGALKLLSLVFTSGTSSQRAVNIQCKQK